MYIHMCVLPRCRPLVLSHRVPRLRRATVAEGCVIPFDHYAGA